ncbi:MAG: hypothetical protein IT435_02575 [Phycisphaerales bacterium]|nr:hypothetical protein [Phycisphaerales bacterium]
MSNDRLIARLVIHGGAELSPKVAKDIADWLQGLSKMMRGRERKRLAKRFTARYFFASKSTKAFCRKHFGR